MTRARGPISNENTRPVKCYKSRNETWMALPEIYRTLPVIRRQQRASAYMPGGPSGFLLSVTCKGNESPIFHETSGTGFARSPTEAAQCGSLTRLLITIVSRTMSSIDRKSGRSYGGKYKSPMSETMRCDIRDCETERTTARIHFAHATHTDAHSNYHPPLTVSSSRFFIFSLLRSPAG